MPARRTGVRASGTAAARRGNKFAAGPTKEQQRQMALARQAETRKVTASSPPIVRSGSGGLSLRGGTRGAWRRDMKGRFA